MYPQMENTTVSVSETKNILPAPVVRKTAPGAKYILVIDDSPTVRAVLEVMLSREGYTTQSFPDGVAAMGWLSGPEAHIPDLIFVDIGLPKLDGYQVIHRFKKNPLFMHVPCVILSARDCNADRLKGKLAGAQMCLTKPFTTQTVSQALRFCLTDAGGPTSNSY